MIAASPLCVTLTNFFAPGRLARLDVPALEQRCLDSLIAQLGSAQAVADLVIEDICYREQPESGRASAPEPVGFVSPSVRLQVALDVATRFAFAGRHIPYGVDFDVALDESYDPPSGSERARQTGSADRP